MIKLPMSIFIGGKATKTRYTFHSTLQNKETNKTLKIVSKLYL